MIGDFHFLRPVWLLALPPLLALLYWARGGVRGRGVWHAVCDAYLIPFVLDAAASPKRLRGLVPSAIAGLLAVVALAGPAWQTLPQPVFRQQSALVVLLDLSRSMDAADVRPSRLDRARLKLLDLLRQRREGQTALVVYAGDAFVVTPLTDDAETITALLQSLSTDLMPVQGSRADRAVERALGLLDAGGIREGALLLVTDGVDAARTAEIAGRVAAAGHRLSVLGVGTPEGAPIPAGGGGFVKDAAGQIVLPRLDAAALQALAARGRGVYSTLRIDDHDIDRVLQDLGAARGEDGLEQTQLETDRWREEGPWLLLLLLPLAALWFRKGVLVVALCAGLQWPDGAVALEWESLWLTPDQRGREAMQAQDYAAAAERFRDARWRAAAMYRAGEYEDAAAALEGFSDPEAAYNRGNALARAGRIDEAKQSYRRALERQPDHEDARHNLALLEQLDNRQPQEQQSGGGEGGEQDGQAPDAAAASGERPGESGSDAGTGGQTPRSVDDTATRDAQPGRDDAATGEREAASGPGASAPGEGSPQTTRQGDDGRGGSERNEGTTAAGPDERESVSEDQQALEQWLRRVPDDPGGLLRRKFRHQYSRRDRNAGGEVQAW